MRGGRGRAGTCHRSASPSQWVLFLILPPSNELIASCCRCSSTSSSTEIKALVKERKDSALKKHSAAVQKFLDELAKIVCEAASKIGPGYLPGPVFFVLEKVSTFVVIEEEKKEEAAPPAEEETSSGVEVKPKEIVVEQEKEESPAPAPESTSSEKVVETPEKVEDAAPVPAEEQPKP
ncbi:Plasma membrane-associated cation-binding protein 1 [Sesamum alatum]|uniref:Plasma membrane-associated cation-binding protein 1 n=1 Tax=Sesamum alatum TaxID=300844 RepID=A0AAE2CG91_9LAMI|nr:Plasma membrane-associated cation-binding protein 1 [Sesamum alatum]